MTICLYSASSMWDVTKPPMMAPATTDRMSFIAEMTGSLLELLNNSVVELLFCSSLVEALVCGVELTGGV